jgi:murein DD-endopeptidase MepM/ murein hydrolase activator NlpD
MKKVRYVVLGIFVVLFSGCVAPGIVVIPVKDATVSDWHPESFWYEPWGASGVHKGIDIFAARDTELQASTNSLILYQGEINRGGLVVLAIDPKWRLHYYAHLESISVNSFDILSAGQKIGTVGDSGNAKGKQPHVHYSIVSLLPYPWRMTQETQGWKKMFYLDPNEYLIPKQAP